RCVFAAFSAIAGWTQTTMQNASGAAIFIGKRFLLVRSVAQRGSDRRELLGFAATRPRWDCVGHASATFRKPASNKEIVQPTKAHHSVHRDNCIFDYPKHYSVQRTLNILSASECARCCCSSAKVKKASLLFRLPSSR